MKTFFAIFEKVFKVYVFSLSVLYCHTRRNGNTDREREKEFCEGADAVNVIGQMFCQNQSEFSLLLGCPVGTSSRLLFGGGGNSVCIPAV